ncbi:Integrase catalytic domain-containing protein [Aphis craccivora]|uniref:Integrase catalytic domain-containing protein n=1 Tax=Aphis craccivora TaxID=307492 RepID=A0A6G0YFH8_APHCR|nr:Integrase catalytic domain-containing protein [Aphis craccivora]
MIVYLFHPFESFVPDRLHRQESTVQRHQQIGYTVRSDKLASSRSASPSPAPEWCVSVIFATMSNEEDKTRNTRLKQRVSTRRDVAASHIRRIHTSATAAIKDSSIMQQVLIAARDLDSW